VENLTSSNFNPEKSFNLAEIQKKTVLLINNGIHAGEPDGIDATIQLFRVGFREIKIQRIRLIHYSGL
jgi:hypothetical protein